MTVHPMRPPTTPKPTKQPALLVDKHGGGLTITFDVKPADVKPFPKP